MLSAKHNDQSVHYASQAALHVGMYVHVDLPWFRHPFTVNAFKIASEKQIRQLRALSLTRFRYDPALSDALPSDASPEHFLEMPAAPTAHPTPAQHAVSLNELAKISISTDPTAATPISRAQIVREYREAVAQTEKSFMKAVGVMRRLNRNLQLGNNAVLHEMDALVDQFVTVFLECPEATLQVMGENCGGEEVYDHRLNVSVTSMMVAKGLKLGGEQARLLGVGALLHDIGVTDSIRRIPANSAAEQLARERELHILHIENGVKIGRQLGLAPQALSIIAQHHELADGSGYPYGLKLEKIAPLARIVSLVNFYDKLCNPVDYAHAMTPHESLAFIYARMKNKFDAEILDTMIRSLGVYPPGSLVKLSNESFALVLSVNPQSPLRPWVMLYDAAVRKEEALLLNLQTEHDISIAKSIRPAMLPSPVYAYLNPRRRITYFFDGNAPKAGGQT